MIPDQTIRALRFGSTIMVLILVLAFLPLVHAAPPTAGFSHSPASPSTADTISFTDTSSDDWNNITNWTWDFGDGTFAYTQDPTHQYADDGTYTVILNVTDNETFSDTFSADIVVTNVAPVSSFTHAPGAPTTNETVSFTDTSSDPDGTVTNWTWDFGDGNISYLQHPTHSYPADGSYPVNLTVRDDDGALHTSSQTLTVGNRAPNASFTSSGMTGDTRTTFTFTDTSTDADGTIVNQTWTLGDGTTRYGASVAHRYAANGTYDVTLTVRDDDGGTASANVTLTVDRPRGGGGILYLPPPEVTTMMHEDPLKPGRFLIYVPIGPDTHSVHIGTPDDAPGVTGIDLEVAGGGSLELEIRSTDSPRVDGFTVGSAFDITLTPGGKTHVLNRVLHLDPDAYPAGADPDQVVLLHGDDGSWEAVPTGEGRAAPSSFSPFAVAIDTAAPTVTPGEDGGFSATDNRGIAEVILYLDGAAVDLTEEAGVYRPIEEPTPGTHDASVIVTDESGLVTEKAWRFTTAGAPTDPASDAQAPEQEAGPADKTTESAESTAPVLGPVLVALAALAVARRRTT